MTKIGRLVVVCTFIGLGFVGATLWAQQIAQRHPRPNPRTVVQSQRVPQRKQLPPFQKVFPAHVVEPPDLVIVEVLEALPGRPISGERLVRPDGTISLGFYGDVKVAGLTLPEVKETIIHHLQRFLTEAALDIVEIDPVTGEVKVDPSTGKPVMLDPKDSATVFVDVTAYNSANYYVEGDILVPGRFPCTGKDTVLDAIHYAGGLLPSADRSKVKLVRSYPKGSPVQVLPVDYDEVTMGTDATTNYLIMPNDRLVVPRDPNYVSSRSATDRSPSGGWRAAAEEEYPSRSNPRAAEKQISSFRKVEKRLSDIEKKLGSLLERMDETSRRAEDQ